MLKVKSIVISLFLSVFIKSTSNNDCTKFLYDFTIQNYTKKIESIKLCYHDTYSSILSDLFDIKEFKKECDLIISNFCKKELCRVFNRCSKKERQAINNITKSCKTRPITKTEAGVIKSILQLHLRKNSSFKNLQNQLFELQAKYINLLQ